MLFSRSLVLPFLQARDLGRRSDLAPMTDQYAFNGMPTPVLAFSPAWSLLGPFQIGTREAAWGADPLEFYGGFSSLGRDTTAKFRSSLARNATVTWSSLAAKNLESTIAGAKASLSVDFPNIDWSFLQAVYGWSALQYQVWARGEIVVNSDSEQTVNVYTDRVLEYVIDGIRHFGGDFYGSRKAPLVLHLSPGKHVIDLRLVRDIRSMGGIGAPTLDVDLELQAVEKVLSVTSDKVIISDVVNATIASPWGSVSVRNNGKDWAEIFGMSDLSIGNEAARIKLSPLGTRKVAPGQTRPVIFRMQAGRLNDTGPIPDTPVALHYRFINKVLSPHSQGRDQELVFTLSLSRRGPHEPHKVTHLHPSNIVSYSILRPPSANATCKTSSAPVMLQFHGAGVEADNPVVGHSLDSLPDLCAWVLFPTGVTPWSADDWHNFGLADVEAAIANIPPWIGQTKWSGPGVDTEKWFISGHSNGGQGSWYALTHRPDKVFAASPVSGYLSIHSYVPYQFWRSMDPKRRAIIEASANSYRHELLASNVKGIPIFQQHGEKDDNVPTYHSRLMNQLLFEAGTDAEYSEIAGQNHYWDGVMATEGLSGFYKKQLENPKSGSRELNDFEITVANPGDMKSKGTVQVSHLVDPGVLGKLRVKFDSGRPSARFETENVLAFTLGERYERVRRVEIDGQGLSFEDRKSAHFWKQKGGGWTLQAPPAPIRHRNQLGGIDAILRSNGSFRIVYDGPESYGLAIQVSRNLQQNFYADAEIVEDGGLHILPFTGNVIRLTMAESLPAPPNHPNFPIRISQSRVLVRSSREFREHVVNDPDVGVVFVRPLNESQLELVVWGKSLMGLAQAARLTPLTTGSGVPDFVILQGESRWKGVEGTSLGFFDALWEVSPSSFLGSRGSKVLIEGKSGEGGLRPK